MKTKELKDKSTSELQALERDLQRSMFDSRFKNFTNRLDDTSLIRKSRRDLARVKTLLAQQAKAAKAVKAAEAPAATQPAAPQG